MITFNKRTYNDGNFFYIPKLNLQAIEEQTALLPKVLLETVKATIKLSKELDEESTLSCSKITIFLNINTDTLNRRLRRLVDINILTRVPFEFSHSKKLRISCYQFTCQDSQDTFEEVTNEQLIAEKKTNTKVVVNNNTKTYKQIAALKREQEKQLYKQSNFAPRPQTSEILPIRQAGNFLVEQCVTTTKLPIQRMAKNIHIGNKTKIKAQITSTSRIMNAEDLQVLFACYSLIQKYHENSTTNNGREPLNRTPIHIADIAAVRGKTTGGNNNNKIRESLECIYNTSFDFYGLGNIDLNSFSISAYMREKFTNFAQCTPLSEIEAEISGDNVIFGNDSMIYLIKLPDDVFKELLIGKYHFVFPQASLSAPCIVFSLYLRFRSRVKDIFNENLRTTWTALAKGSEYKDFKISLKSQMMKVNKKLKNIEDPYSSASYDEKEQRLTFNLWGYHGYICFKENYLNVKCHEKEMFEACKVSITNSHVSHAPTIENHLRAIFEPELKLESSLPKNISKVIKSYGNKYDVMYELKNENTYLSVYCTERERDHVTAALVNMYHLDEFIVIKKIDHDLAKLHHLCLKGRMITQADFEFIVDYFGLFHVETYKIVKFLSTYRSIHDDIITLLDSKDASELLITKFEKQSW